MKSVMSRRAFVFECGCFVALAGCAGQSPLGGQIGSSVGAAIGVGEALIKKPKFTDDDEARAAQANAQKFEGKNKMWEDPLLETYLTEITQRVVAVAKPRPFPYRTRVVMDPVVNAFTFGGGLVYFNAGLIARMENEAQLAMVMGHELAHVTERHIPRGIERTYGIQLLGQLALAAGSATGTLPLKGAALEKAYDYTMNAAVNGHGRGLETEADEVGLDYLVKAGYDPREAPHTFEQLLKEYGDKAPIVNFFYGSHPTNVERIERLTGFVMAKYAGDGAGRRLVVNTEEFKRRTRQVVIATGRLDYEGKRFNTATAMFQKAIRAWDGDPVPHYYLGKIAQETGAGQAIDRAIGHFADSIKADASYPPAHRELGMAYYRKNERAKAIESLERYLALEPQAKDTAAVRNAIVELKRY